MARITDHMTILKIAKKRKRVTARQGEADYWTLEDMVKLGLLHRTLPSHKKAYGWPVYILTRKGLKSVEKCQSR